MTNHKVPEYSQHLDIKDKTWKDKACGITALKMILEYNLPKSPSIDELIKIGLKKDAYIPGIGWKHKELTDIARDFNLNSKSFDWSDLTPKEAFINLKKYFPKNPVLASIHKNFNKNNGGHLIVLTGMKDNAITYNEPDAKKRSETKQSITKEGFLNGWKKRVIIIF